MNWQKETGESVSHVGHSGRDWLSGLNWPRAQGSGCHLAEPQESTLAASSCVNSVISAPGPPALRQFTLQGQTKTLAANLSGLRGGSLPDDSPNGASSFQKTVNSFSL